MRIAKNTVVAIDYKLTNDDGELLDTSEGNEPLSYLHGVGEIIPGLERELDGKEAGDRLQVAVAAEEGYGQRDEQLKQKVERDQFEDVDELEVGMQFQVESDGDPEVVTVVQIADDIITVDGNHPFAGVKLNFDVTVREVREATEEELAHGHAHGPDGHCD